MLSVVPMKWRAKPISSHRRLENKAGTAMHYASCCLLGLVKWIFAVTSYEFHWMKFSEVMKRRNSSHVVVNSQEYPIFISYKITKTCICPFTAAEKVLHFCYVFSSKKVLQTKIESSLYLCNSNSLSWYC